MKIDSYQLIVVGAGSGGSTIASEAAKKGLPVILIDKQKKEKIGEKSTYDIIPSYVFDKLGLPVPSGEEVNRIIKNLKIFSPSKRYYFETSLGAYLIHRLKFGQRLLNMALDNGAVLHDETEFTEPIIENGFIVGIRCITSRGEHNEYMGKIVCDASGYPGVVRNMLPGTIYCNEELALEDCIKGYREVRDINASSETIPDSEYPGLYCFLLENGYAWIVPENNSKGNIGFQILTNAMNLDPEKLTEEFCNSLPEHLGKKIHAAGTGPTSCIPIRTCQSDLVGNGFFVLGDAAFQASPLSAFGMASSMIAGKIAADTAVAAIQNNDVSRKGMWEYNIRYKRGLGASMAFIDPIRIFLQNIPEKEIEILVKKDLLGQMEFSLVWSDQSFTYTWIDKIKKFFIGFSHLFLLLKFMFVYSICKKMEKHYRRYPLKVKNFNSWCLKRKELYAQLFRKLKIKRSI